VLLGLYVKILGINKGKDNILVVLKTNEI